RGRPDGRFPFVPVSSRIKKSSIDAESNARALASARIAPQSAIWTLTPRPGPDRPEKTGLATSRVRLFTSFYQLLSAKKSSLHAPPGVTWIPASVSTLRFCVSRLAGAPCGPAALPPFRPRGSDVATAYDRPATRTSQGPPPQSRLRS